MASTCWMWITGSGSVIPRAARTGASRHAEQAALRDGDWKYLKLGKNESLFNLAGDERERAELSRSASLNVSRR